ncbi:Dyp-type peroxidase [Specibacter sp. RAF43]|uniref:Dyp-type peroxidase n=1 Tax=Specibacter sp. RAF43 TaxID=3233057 RepID=UPI003F9844DA
MPPESSPTGRRTFLRHALATGAVGATAVASAIAPSPVPAHAQDAGVSAPESTRFEGPHQAGIYRPALPQSAACFAVFTLTAANGPQLQQLLQTITDRARALTAGGSPVAAGSGVPPSDSGVLGAVIPADGLTITVGLGHGAFAERFGLEGKLPKGLSTMRIFDDDVPDPAWLGGDILLQVCANAPDTVHHALRELTRATRAWMQPQWQINGFISPPRPSGASRNLFGYKDGIANPGESDGLVWIGPESGQPAWAVGGTFIVVRLIRMLVEFWDRVSLSEQDTMIGRRRDSGAPLDGNVESDAPDYKGDPNGAVIPLAAHIRLANPRTTLAESSRLLRRGYNYVLGTDATGNQNVGLIFACYQASIQDQFEAVQERLAGEPMTDYIQAFGGQYFIGLPGVTGDGYLGEGLFT